MPLLLRRVHTQSPKLTIQGTEAVHQAADMPGQSRKCNAPNPGKEWGWKVSKRTSLSDFQFKYVGRAREGGRVSEPLGARGM